MDEAFHESIILGYFGIGSNMTNHQHAYFCNPFERGTTAYACAVMATGFRSSLAHGYLAQAEAGRFLGHIPLCHIPQPGKIPLGEDDTPGRQRLFDIAADLVPGYFLHDEVIETRMRDLLREQLGWLAALAARTARMGL